VNGLAITAFALRGDARAIATSDVRTHRVEAGGRELPGVTVSVFALAFGRDGSLLAGGGADGAVRLWRMPEGTLAREWPGHSQSVTCLAVSPDGRLVVSGSEDGTVRIRRIAGEEAHAFPAHGGGVHAAVFQPDGSTLATAGADGKIKIWHPGTGALLRTMSPGGEIESLDATGAILASGGPDVRLWDVASGRELCAVPYGPVTRVLFNADGTILAAAGGRHEVRLWSVRK
jgi:WD40 repeat protein